MRRVKHRYHNKALSLYPSDSTSAAWIFTRTLLLGFAVTAVIAIGIITHSLAEMEQRALDSSRVASEVFIKDFPSSAPSMSQHSIDAAVKFFEIDIPRGVRGPLFDPTLGDRGLTTRKGAYGKLTVHIGPDAFSSWALLGSTIAHEIEVHCRQNFLAIHLMDLGGFDGTGTAEREAYSYELQHAKRFGLSPYDQDLIRSTMGYYYPHKKSDLREFPTVKTLIQRVAQLDLR
jgi:hypothetical protein